MSSEQENDIQLQLKIYNFIVNYIRDEGMPPTNREIGRAMMIASTGRMYYHLNMLERMGLITRQPRKSRGIKLIKPPTGRQYVK